MIGLLILDWSGVISDDRKPVYEAGMRMLEARGKKRFPFDEWLLGSLASAPAFFEAHGITDDWETIRAEFVEMFSTVRDEGLHPTLYPDALSFLQALSSNHIDIAVISSHPQEHLEREAREYGIDRYVPTLLGNTKDKATAIETQVSERLVPKERVVYVGDMIFDIQAAKHAGVPAIGVTTGYHGRARLEAEQPDLVVDSLAELFITLAPHTA